jgi:hypothetical protein
MQILRFSRWSAVCGRLDHSSVAHIWISISISSVPILSTVFENTYPTFASQDVRIQLHEAMLRPRSRPHTGPRGCSQDRPPRREIPEKLRPRSLSRKDTFQTLPSLPTPQQPQRKHQSLQTMPPTLRWNWRS